MPTCHACGAETPAGKAHGPAGGIFDYVPSPHMKTRRKAPPRRTAPALHEPGAPTRFNTWLGVHITNGVGTMWCAYAFAAIALISLPEAIHAGTSATVSWIAQTFLQLVLLSIIMVGQKVEGAASENRAIDTYKDAEALLAEVVEIQKHLLAQDACLQQLIDAHRAGEAPPRAQSGAPEAHPA